MKNDRLCIINIVECLNRILLCFILILSGIIYPELSSADNERTFTLAVLDLEPNGVSRFESRGLSDKLRSIISQLIQNTQRKLQCVKKMVPDPPLPTRGASSPK